MSFKKIGLFIGFFVLSSCSSLKQKPRMPDVFFEHSFLYESKCKKSEGYSDIKRLGKKKWPSILSQWKVDGDRFFKVLFEDIGKGFERKELDATITYCGHGSISTPLIIDLYREIKYDQARPDFSPSILIFHELLHTYVVDNVNFPTPLTIKYKKEAKVVRSHLHLMALQLYVFKKLNLAKHINYLNSWHSLMGPHYKRAWTIVTELEDYNDFLAEVR